MKTAKYYSVTAEKEFMGYINAPASFPVSFTYNGKHYKGFPDDVFGAPQLAVISGDKCEKTIMTYSFDVLKITVEAELYADYGVYNWCVWFENVSEKNSGVISELLAADMEFDGNEPILSGVLGDGWNHHAPYEYELKKQNIGFRNTLGRATHIYFPYFTLLTLGDSASISIGWGGSWQAEFNYDGITHFKGTGTVDLCTYLKPNEKIRTALITIARFKGHDFDQATNQWRKWYFDCWCPKENGVHLKPFTTSCISGDTGKPNTDGSISEGHDTWYPTLSKLYGEKLRLDYRWIDAGWYYDAENKTVPSDWFGSVGTWELDKDKWPDDTLLQSVKYAEEHGSRTLMWFEPERACDIPALAKNHGYNPDWALGYDKEKDSYIFCGISVFRTAKSAINNLGDPDCFKWTLARILNTMEENGIHMYREDFNVNPGPFWVSGDKKQGKNRVGITENLYVQGHYALWDAILDYCRKKGKTTFVDICAGGGGRNDMESMRRGVPLLRSDSDRTTIALRLSFTTSLAKWIPFAGCSAKESVGELDVGTFDEYVWRASIMGSFNYGFEFAHDPTINYDEVRRGIKEWEEVSPYITKEFYPHTPWHTATDRTGWTVFSYYDSDTEKGVIQAFRQEDNGDLECTVKLQYADETKTYDLCDIDKGNSFAGISGKQLREGLTLKLEQPRSAAIIYINAK